MDCTDCGRVNRAGARFCGGCGSSLAPRCPSCGAESEPTALFCDACGNSLALLANEPQVTRRVVTIVFADLVGSTALHERLDAESARLFMERYYLEQLAGARVCFDALAAEPDPVEHFAKVPRSPARGA